MLLPFFNGRIPETTAAVFFTVHFTEFSFFFYSEYGQMFIQ